MAPLSTIIGIIKSGITIYIVIAELNEAEIFNPSILAQKAVVNNASQ
jgi:hypothetical protein